MCLLIKVNATVQEITSSDDWAKLKKESRDKGLPIIIDFTATWCGPCKNMKQPFHDLAAATPSMLFVKADVSGPGFPKQLKGQLGHAASGIPLFLVLNYFKPGSDEVVDQQKGASKQALEALVKKHASSDSGTGSTSKTWWTPTKIGIAVVCVVLLIAIPIAVWCCCCGKSD